MKTIQIKDCSYEKFEAIRDIIYEYIPFSIVHLGYSKKLKLAIFNFWDSDYIPDKLKLYIMPLNKALLTSLNEKLRQVLFRIN